MKRNPSIHILFSDFVSILEKEGYQNPNKLAARIFKAAIPYNVKDRYIITGDSEVRKQARKIVAMAGTKGLSVEKFNRWLTTIRMQEGHRGVVPLKPTEVSGWRQLGEITQLANEFSAANGLNPEEGAKIFIKLGITLMKHSYRLSKFKFYREEINEIYQAADMVINDPEEEKTQEVYRIWLECLKKYGGHVYKLERYEQFVYMVYVRMECDSIGASYRDWLVAQFEWFQIFSNVPSLKQLVTQAALDRYNEYMAKKGGNKKAIRNDTTDYTDEFNQRYFQAVRNKIGQDD